MAWHAPDWRCLPIVLAVAGAADAALAQSAERGQAVYESRCVACHGVDLNRVGPRHRGVLGRTAGKLADFDGYSDALRQSRLVWSREALALWLTDPEGLIPGQGMGFRLSSAQDRDDVVAYLATLK
jgi:cytochrome c